MKLQEAEEAVKDGEGWLDLDELKALVGNKMLKLRINPIVAKDLKNIRDYIAEDNEEYAAKTIKEIYGKFENLQMFPEWGRIYPNGSAFGQIINMRYGKIM